jgi:hypothetical protein
MVFFSTSATNKIRAVFTLNDIKKFILPDADDELAKKFGFEKLEETPLRYFEIQAGYFTEGFNGKEATARDRHLFVGIGLNLEELLFGRKNEKESTCKFAGRQFLQRAQIPYTYYTNNNDAYHY